MNALFGTPLSIMPLYAIRSEKATGSPSTTSSAPVVTAVAPQRSSVFTASAVLTAQAAAPPITWSVKPVAVTMRSAFSSSPEERSTPPAVKRWIVSVTTEARPELRAAKRSPGGGWVGVGWVWGGGFGEGRPRVRGGATAEGPRGARTVRHGAQPLVPRVVLWLEVHVDGEPVGQLLLRPGTQPAAHRLGVRLRQPVEEDRLADVLPPREQVREPEQRQGRRQKKAARSAASA